MTIDRRRFLQLGSSSAALSLLPSTFAETARRPPIIDVHLHAYPLDAPIPAVTNPATGKTIHLKDGAAHRAACLAEMKRLNIVKAVVSGGDGDRLAAAMAWHDADPGRIIPGAGIRGSEDTPLPELSVLRSAFTDGRMRVLGEVTTQYAGLTLDTPNTLPIWRLRNNWTYRSLCTQEQCRPACRSIPAAVPLVRASETRGWWKKPSTATRNFG